MRRSGFSERIDFKQGRLERFYPGIAASVAVLCGPSGLFPLPACRQRLSDDGRFRYLGGSCPLEPALARRATSLAIRAIRSLADPLGYLGVDLVLGADPNGQDDVVIEINPRLTTSYVGLRAIASGNLAAAMLAVAEGRTASLSFGDGAVEFDADGTVRRLPPARRYRILSFLIPGGAGGNLRIHRGQSLAENLADRQIAIPMMVGRDHVPRRVARAASRQHVFIGPLIVVPVFPFLDVQLRSSSSISADRGAFLASVCAARRS